MENEIEVKILEIDVDEVVKKLENIGAKKIVDANIVAEFFINSDAKKIRLRRVDGKNILTFKNKYESSDFLKTDEIEIFFDDYEKMKKVLIELEFIHYGSSEKTRTTYKYKNIHFEIDTLPGIPTFLEIESVDMQGVKNGVELLGYKMSQTCILTERTVKEHYGLA